MNIPILVEKTIEVVKEAFDIAESHAHAEQEKYLIGKFDGFFRYKLLATLPKAEMLFLQFEKNRTDAKLEGKLEAALEEIFAKEKIIRTETHQLLREVFEEKGINLDNLLADTKEEEQKLRETKTVPSEIASILVPWDFTVVAENALQHAEIYAEILNGKIYLFHVVKKDKEVEPAMKRLQVVADEASKKSGYEIIPVVKEGTIFNTITDFSSEINSKLVIMGTHGISGMQKFTGSKALKVVAGTTSPFIVVHNSPEKRQVKNVLFPVDDRRENKMMLLQAKFLAEFYDLHFHIVLPSEFNTKKIENATINSLVYAKSFFKQYGIDFTVLKIETTKDFTESVLRAAEVIEPDLIMLLVTKEIGFSDYFMGANEEKIITNRKKIPVMCINPKPGKGWSYSSTGG